MEELRYYEELSRKTLMAYEKSTEFFVKYDPATNSWQDCPITFMQFKNDYEYRRIDREEAQQKTGGVLPESMYQDYVNLLQNNRG